MGLMVSEFLARPASILTAPPPILANMTMKINGNSKLNTTADGLRNIERKLALVIDNVALRLLYDFMM
jgi:hypothetical protein